MTNKERLNNELDSLDKISKSLIQTGKTMLETHAVYPFDLYCGAILNRTINLNYGFIGQTRDDNFISSAPLVRISLDSLLRLFAAYQVDYNIDDFAKKVIEGMSINNMKDKSGARMTDSYLADSLSKKRGFNWVRKIYNTGNEYVHFTSQHIFASIELNHATKEVNGLVAKGDAFIPIDEKIWAAKAMIQITVGITMYILKWTEHKQKTK